MNDQPSKKYKSSVHIISVPQQQQKVFQLLLAIAAATQAYRTWPNSNIDNNFKKKYGYPPGVELNNISTLCFRISILSQEQEVVPYHPVTEFKQTNKLNHYILIYISKPPLGGPVSELWRLATG